MTVNNELIIELIQTLEENFKEDLTEFKEYITKNNYTYKINNYKIELFGYYEITDYFRRFLDFKVPTGIHKGKIKYILNENNKCNFYDYKNEILFSIPTNKNYFNIKPSDLKVFSAFCY